LPGKGHDKVVAKRLNHLLAPDRRLGFGPLSFQKTIVVRKVQRVGYALRQCPAFEDVDLSLQQPIGILIGRRRLHVFSAKYLYRLVLDLDAGCRAISGMHEE
jgi:hypothetical protein